MLSKRDRFVPVFLCSVLAASASGQHHSPEHHGHDEHPAALRLLISDAASPTLRMLDLESGQVVGQFTVPGAAAGVYAVPGGQYGIAVHRDQNRITVVHSGYTAEDHGDHQDLVTGHPYVVFTANVGSKPTHFYADTAGQRAVIYNDGDGSVVLLDPHLFGTSLDYAELASAGADHGALGMVEDNLFVGYSGLGRVDVFSLDGQRLATAEGCPRAHGSANVAGGVMFGCADGVLWVGQRGEAWESVKIANPAGTPEGTRVGTLMAVGNTVVGNWGAGLAIIDLEQRRIRSLGLSAAPIRFLPHESGDITVLTRDGQLHAVQGAAVRRSVQVYTPAAGEGPVGSMVEAAEDLLISVPHRGEVLRVNPGTFAVEARYRVGGQPLRLAPLGLSNAATHD